MADRQHWDISVGGHGQLYIIPPKGESGSVENIYTLLENGTIYRDLLRQVVRQQEEPCRDIALWGMQWEALMKRIREVLDDGQSDDQHHPGA